MKTATRETISKSNMSGAGKVKMSIDPEGMAHIARIVTDLYADPDSAVLREYSANGLDSHVLAGQTRPVEITLPTASIPTLKVQDWGVGMSRADITDIYSKYGASTKRDSNNQIGAFGLGCKSALSMSPSFTLTSIKDGIKVIAVIHRGEDGVGEIEFASETETDDPNGVTVYIPVSEGIKEYASKAKAIFITWPRGSVLVDGKEPELSITSDDDFITLGKHGYLSRSSVRTGNYYARNGSITVNMGGIGYPVTREQTDILLNGLTEAAFPSDMAKFLWNIKAAIRNSLTLVVNVDMGNVDLVPSRESVRWTRRSQKAVIDVIKDCIVAIPVAIAEDFKDCNTRMDVLSKNVMDFAESFRSIYSEVEWKGDKLPKDIHMTLGRPSAYYEADVENFVLRYDKDGDRIPATKRDSTIAFSFGFESKTARSFSVNGEEKKETWIFVAVKDAETIRKTVSGFANTYIQDLRATGDVSTDDTIKLVAYTGDLMENKWFKAAYDSSEKMFSVELETLVERSKSRRTLNKAAAASGRPAVASGYTRPELTYFVVVTDANGSSVNKDMTPTQINAEATANGSKVYLDDNKWLRTELYSSSPADRVRPFLPRNSMLVSRGAGRKFEALQKRVTVPVSDTLEKDVHEEIRNFVKTVTVEDYFGWSSPHALLQDDRLAAELDDGFLKTIMSNTPGKEEKREKLRALSSWANYYGPADLKNWDKKFESLREKLVKTCILAFGARPDYGIDKEVYRKALAGYLNGLNSEIAKLVK